MSNIEGRLDIASRRNEARTLTIRVVGADWSGLAWRQQVRLGPDTPGTPLLNIAQVNSANAEGLFVVGVTTENGLPITTVRLRYNMSTMRDGLPYPGEVGADAKFAHAIQVNGQTRLAGDWWAVASVMDSDASPANRPQSYGVSGGGAPAISAAVGIAVVAEEIVSIVVDGAEQLGALVQQSKAAVADAVAQVTLATAQVALAVAAKVAADGYAQASSRSAAASATSVGLVATARDLALQQLSTATTAFQALNITYVDQATGLAATADGRFFAVAGTGEVAFTLYRRVNGVAQFYVVVPGRAALDRIGRFVPNGGAVDNAVAINAALSDPLVSGVLLPAGNIRLDHAIVVPSGKFLRGAGVDATILTRTNNLAGAAFEDKAIVRFATGAVAASVSDFTAIAPKTNVKVQAAWMINNRFCLVERVKAVNMGYAFFAQEGSQFCTFRDIQSFNANVHFETTAASDILFENTYARDGDGDNPLGFEGVWHTLFGSKRVTFRNGDHIGKGTPFLVVADSGAGDAGLIDDIRFENCRSVCTTGVNSIQISKIDASASVGRVKFREIELATAGGNLNVEQGQITFEGGRIATTSQEAFQMGPGTSLLATDVYAKMDAPNGATGNFYNATNAPIVVQGGTVEVNTSIVEIGVGPYLTVSPETRFITPRQIYTPEKGRTVSYVYPVDVPLLAGTEVIGVGTSQPQAVFDTVAGARYRLRLVGKLKKTGAAGLLRLYVVSTGPIATTSGTISIERADRTFLVTLDGEGFGDPRVQMADVPVDAVRGVQMDIELTGQGGGTAVVFGSDGVTLLAGGRIVIERLS